MCDDCKKQKKDPSSCNHNDHRNPQWLSGASKKRAKFFMSSQAMYAREVLGVTTSDENSLFEQWLGALTDKPRFIVDRNPGYVLYSYIDPHGISATGQSETAICTVLRTPDPDCRCVIVGLTSWDTQNERETNDLIISYFRNFALNETYYRLQHYLVVENNFGGGLMASWFVNRATSGLPTIQQYHPNQNKDGLALFRRLKNEAVMTMVSMFDEDRIDFAQRIITAGVQKADDLRQKLLKQLGSFRKVWEGSNWTYTGKMPNSPDDLALCFLMATKISADCTILARLNEEQRALLDENNQHAMYDDIPVNDAPFSGTRLSAHHHGAESWRPHY